MIRMLQFALLLVASFAGSFIFARFSMWLLSQ